MRGRIRLLHVVAGATALTLTVASVQLVRATGQSSPGRPGAQVASAAAMAHATAAAAWHGERRRQPKPAHSTTVSVRRVTIGSPTVHGAAVTRDGVSTGSVTARPAALTTSAKAPKAVAATPSAPFGECPAIGEDTSCGNLVDVTDTGTAILSDPGQGPYDGSDDTLVGVLNESGADLAAIVLSSDTDAFAFDGDGICSDGFLTSPPCPYGPTGYEGPNTSFADVNAAQTAGTVDFTTPIPPGGTAYFSLEEALAATDVFGGGPSVGEQGGATNPGELSSTCSCGDPVNDATGDFWHTFTDFSVPGRGAPLDLTRTYTSGFAGTDGPFGFGWADSYGMSLSTDSSGAVTVHQENGSELTFQPAATGFSAPPRVLASLIQNSDGTFTFVRDADHVRNLFSAAGQLLSQTDLNGETTKFAYAGSQLTSVTDAAGRSLTFTYSGTHVASVTDPLGRAETYTYDAAGDLASSTDAAGRTWDFGYDANHLLLTMTDPRGGVTKNVYDGGGRMVTQTDPNGAVTKWSYNGNAAAAAGGTTTLTEPNGSTTAETYANLELTSMTAAVGTLAQAVTTYTRDAATLGVMSVTDPDGHVSSASYDGQGDLLSAVDALGRATLYTYNSLNERTSTRLPSGQSTSSVYDGSGNLDIAYDALGNATTYVHGDAAHPGDVTSVTDAAGRVFGFTYDAGGQVATTTVTPAAGVTQTSQTVRDADGEVVCTASATAVAAGHGCPAAGGARVAGTSTTVYDAVGEVTATTDADGGTTSRTYDGDGNLLTSTDASGNKSAYTYDADNDALSVTAANGTHTSASYDASGNLLTQVDGDGNSTAYAYDALNRAVSKTDPIGRATDYVYDPAGNQIAVVDASARTTTTAFDVANEPTGITYSDGKTPTVGYTYTSNGQRATMTDGSGTTTYAYDADGRVTATTDGAGAKVGYGYDAAGDITTLTYPNGQTATRAYDGAGQLVSVKDWLGNTTSFGFDADGNETSTRYGNGAQTTAGYDAADRLTSILDMHDTATLASFAYTRSATGLVTSDTETGTAIPYTYDALNRVTGAGTGNAYGYDAAGRPLALAGGITQSFDAAGELTSSGPGTSPTPTPTPTTTTLLPTTSTPSSTSSPTPTLTPTPTSTSSNPTTPSSTTTSSSSPTPPPTTTSSPTTPSPTPTSTSNPSGSPTPTPSGPSTSASSAPPPPPGTVALDKLVNGTEEKSASPITSPALTTSHGGELILAFVSADGPGGGAQKVTAVSGGGLAWSLASRADQVKGTGTAEIWQAYAAAPLAAVKIKATLAAPNWDGAITVAAYTGAAPRLGAVANDGARAGAPSVTLATTAAGSLVVAAGHDWSHASTQTPVAGQKILSQNLDTRVQDTYWAQTTGPIATPAKTTVADASPKDGRWELAAAEIEPSATAPAAAAATARRAAVLTAGGTTAYTYDAEGDRTSATAQPAGPTTVYTYDQARRLTSVTAPGTTATYTYNGVGLRASKTVNGTTTPFAWDVSTATPALLSDGTTSYLYGPDGSPIEQITGTAPTYLMTDQQGSVRVLTDATGTVTGAYGYDAYGNTTTHTGTATTPLGYDGQYTDSETGLVYLRARYYDPATAQFMTVDPLAAASGTAYGYAGDDPVNAGDSSGLLSFGDMGNNLLKQGASAVVSILYWRNRVIQAITPSYVVYDVTFAAPQLNGLAGVSYVHVLSTDNWYAAPIWGIGTPGPSVQERLGWTLDPEVDSFVQGASWTASGMLPTDVPLVGVAGGVTWGNLDQFNYQAFAAELGLGLGTPGVSLSRGNYQQFYPHCPIRHRPF